MIWSELCCNGIPARLLLGLARTRVSLHLLHGIIQLCLTAGRETYLCPIHMLVLYGILTSTFMLPAF